MTSCRRHSVEHKVGRTFSSSVALAHVDGGILVAPFLTYLSFHIKSQ